MMLGGQTILEEIKKGNIVIEPFDEKLINPNSYNLRLGANFTVYQEEELEIECEIYKGVPVHHIVNTPKMLDMRTENKAQTFNIPFGSGLLIEPGRVYLGHTMERTKTDKYAPILEGRSSVGRLGLNVHVTAGFGDVGFDGTWTLELVSTQSIIIYPGTPICQISYYEVTDNSIQYNSKYSGQINATASKLHLDFK